MQAVNPGAKASLGKPAWNKGVPMRQESRMKLSKTMTGSKRPGSGVNISKALKGRKITWADKISKAHIGKAGMRGKLASNWQGGKTPELKRLRNSTEYAKWRKAVFQRDDYTCVICKQRGGWLEADHIKAFAHYPEHRFDINNGRTLCVDCHRQTDNYGWKARKYA